MNATQPKIFDIVGQIRRWLGGNFQKYYFRRKKLVHLFAYIHKYGKRKIVLKNMKLSSTVKKSIFAC